MENAETWAAKHKTETSKAKHKTENRKLIR
jgi:hypothetical protein